MGAGRACRPVEQWSRGAYPVVLTLSLSVPSPSPFLPRLPPARDLPPPPSPFLSPPQKIRARYTAAPAQSATLEQLVENEKGEKKRTATEGLLWLLRCVLLCPGTFSIVLQLWFEDGGVGFMVEGY